MNCRVCDSGNLELALDLGTQPWANHFLKKDEIGTEPLYPLRVVFCGECKTAQLDYTVKKEIMFGDHTYLSGITKSLSEHFKNVAGMVDHTFFNDVKDKSVLDIGSNDGTQLKHYQDLGYEILGVESSKTIVKIANQFGIPTINAFFNLGLAKDINRKFQVINASGVFFHLEELHSVAEGIRESLAENGIFIVQFLYMKQIMENLAFDQIYHEHLLYYTLHSIDKLLHLHGLIMFDAFLSPIHGGSIVGFITHIGDRSPSKRLQMLKQAEINSKCNEYSSYVHFGERINQMKTETLAFLDSVKQESKTIFGFGAPVKGNTMLNLFGIGTQYLDCLVEKNEMRRDLYSPGMHIPIVMEKELKKPPDIYFVLAWNFKKEILTNNRSLIDQGIEFYFPVNPKEIQS
ncbi:class I SAM-dependent methyltransferase [Thermodesulfobacteriota bacterium]